MWKCFAIISDVSNIVSIWCFLFIIFLLIFTFTFHIFSIFITEHFLFFRSPTFILASWNSLFSSIFMKNPYSAVWSVAKNQMKMKENTFRYERDIIFRNIISLTRLATRSSTSTPSVRRPSVRVALQENTSSPHFPTAVVLFMNFQTEIALTYSILSLGSARFVLRRRFSFYLKYILWTVGLRPHF